MWNIHTLFLAVYVRTLEVLSELCTLIINEYRLLKHIKILILYLEFYECINEVYNRILIAYTIYKWY